MTNIIPKDTRYVPFTQQYSCCVPTSISMVMYRLNLPLVPQELFGYHLGLIIDDKNKNLFWNARTGKRPPSGYGTQINKKQYEINAVFRKLKIPMHVTEYPIGQFETKKSLTYFMADNIKQNKDLIVILASDVLNGTRKYNGHACVIDRVYPTRNVIRLIDPLPKQPKWREFTIEKFIKAIKLHPAGTGRI